MDYHDNGVGVIDENFFKDTILPRLQENNKGDDNIRHGCNDFNKDHELMKTICNSQFEYESFQNYEIGIYYHRQQKMWFAYYYDKSENVILSGIRFVADSNFPNIKIMGYYDLTGIGSNPDFFVEGFLQKLDINVVNPNSCNKIRDSLCVLTTFVYRYYNENKEKFKAVKLASNKQ